MQNIQSHKLTNRNRNVPAVVLMAAVVVLAFGLHLGQAYTGPLWLPRAGGDYGRPGFEIGPLPYPRQIVDGEGYPLNLASPARTFTGTEWTIEEFLYSVVPPEKIVGVSGAAYDRSYSNVYVNAEKYRPAIVGPIAPSAELVVRAGAELVVAAPEHVDVFNILTRAGMPVYRMYTQLIKLDQIANNI